MLCEMQQPCPGFELTLLSPFLTTVTIIPEASPKIYRCLMTLNDIVTLESMSKLIRLLL